LALILTGFEIFGSISLHLATPDFEKKPSKKNNVSTNQNAFVGAGAGARKF